MTTKFLLLSVCMFFLNISDIGTAKYTLTIKTDGLRNSGGTIICALYNQEGSIPDQKLKKYYKKVHADINLNKSEIIFNDLPQGLYAVTIIHDENNNGKLDTKFLLPLPDEGVGFSNYEDVGVKNRPNFKKASFNLNNDTTIVVKVNYK